MATSKRALARRLLRRASKKTSERLMNLIGGKLVSGMADTSADAPSGGYAPKRSRYAEMQAEQEAERLRAREAADEDHGHSHSHSHGHDHDHSHGH